MNSNMRNGASDSGLNFCTFSPAPVWLMVVSQNKPDRKAHLIERRLAGTGLLEHNWLESSRLLQMYKLTFHWHWAVWVAKELSEGLISLRNMFIKDKMPPCFSWMPLVCTSWYNTIPVFCTWTMWQIKLISTIRCVWSVLLSFCWWKQALQLLSISPCLPPVQLFSLL